MAATKKKEKEESLIDKFNDFAKDKQIDRTTLVSVLEESFRNVIAKIFGSDENFDVIVNPDKGDCEIYRNRTVVNDGEVVDENKEIALTEARKIADDYEVGEEVSEPVNFEKFGRRAILNLGRHWPRRFWSWSTTRSTTSTRTAWDKSSAPRSIRCGNAKCCS